MTAKNVCMNKELSVLVSLEYIVDADLQKAVEAVKKNRLEATTKAVHADDAEDVFSNKKLVLFKQVLSSWQFRSCLVINYFFAWVCVLIAYMETNI